MDALLLAWNVALVDNELAPREEQLLSRFARAMQLSDTEASMAARGRRVILPLERLGIHADRNPALFRFLHLCARTPGVSKIDHCTFVTAFEHTELFLEHWAERGFGLHGEWNTERCRSRSAAPAPQSTARLRAA